MNLDNDPRQGESEKMLRKQQDESSNYMQEIPQTDSEKIKMYQETCTFDEFIQMHINYCLAYKYIPRTFAMYKEDFTFKELARAHIKLEKRGMNPAYSKPVEVAIVNYFKKYLTQTYF